jgi:hypothetical protein
MRSVSVVVVLAAVVLGVSSAGALGSTVFRDAGITLRAPSGWWVNDRPLTRITNPVQRFVLSSYRVPGGADAGGSYTPSPQGVLAELTEDVPAGASARGWPSRPQRFVLLRLGRMETLNGNRWGEVVFRDQGRHFYLFIWVGRHAAPAQISMLLRALDGMTIRAP